MYCAEFTVRVGFGGFALKYIRVNIKETILKYTSQQKELFDRLYKAISRYADLSTHQVRKTDNHSSKENLTCH